ncbi:unnamed protein product [Owenia fusiformis]|uniref:Uncharacterized protein n=1 Tax=Owenia fusiformis TaxID=6347 RepID=A0A8J1U4P0_OWEFU|nr:unnamed protein product [Owenia fusiformis]
MPYTEDHDTENNNAKDMVNDKAEKERSEHIKHIASYKEEKRQLISEIENLENVLNKLRLEFEDMPTANELSRRRQAWIDEERDIAKKEDELVAKQKGLEEYEKEIEVIEGYLNRRQKMCDHKEQDLKTLDDQLTELNDELQQYREDLKRQGVDVDSPSGKAKLNWEYLRGKVIDREKQLETTIKNIRSENIANCALIAVKDQTINDLKNKMKETDELLGKHEIKIKQLESRLTLAIHENNQQTGLDSNCTNNTPQSSISMNSRKHSSSRLPSIGNQSPQASTYQVPNFDEKKPTNMRRPLRISLPNPPEETVHANPDPPMGTRHKNLVSEGRELRKSNSMPSKHRRRTVGHLEFERSRSKSQTDHHMKIDAEKHSSTTCIVM